MKRLAWILVLLLLTVHLLPQFGALNKLKKAKDVADKAKKVGEAMRPINEKEEFFIGRSVAAQILAKYPLLKNEAITLYVSLVGTFLALRSERPEIYAGYHFAVLDSEEINAFAAPGGIILLTRGLVNSCASEDELAAVIAHEISHVVVKDPIKMIKQSRMKALFALGAEELAKGGPQVVGLFKDSVLDVTGTLLEKGYSRGQEKNADLAALHLLDYCGYSPAALLSMLQKLQAREVKKSKAYSAHPPAKDRCKYTEQELRSITAPPAPDARTARFHTAIKLAGI